MAKNTKKQQAAIHNALSAAINYFVDKKGLGFDQFETDLELLLNCILGTVPGFSNCKLKLHVLPTQTHFDIGIVFHDGFLCGARLVEVERGKKTETTLH